jgi:hypothetical protein
VPNNPHTSGTPEWAERELRSATAQALYAQSAGVANQWGIADVLLCVEMVCTDLLAPDRIVSVMLEEFDKHISRQK